MANNDFDREERDRMEAERKRLREMEALLFALLVLRILLVTLNFCLLAILVFELLVN